MKYVKQIRDKQAISQSRRLVPLVLIGMFVILLLIVINFVALAIGIHVSSNVIMSVAYAIGITFSIIGLFVNRDID
jgi:hypothetical protein